MQIEFPFNILVAHGTNSNVFLFFIFDHFSRPTICFIWASNCYYAWIELWIWSAQINVFKLQLTENKECQWSELVKIHKLSTNNQKKNPNG